ncbi:MAG: type II CAAX endopeptidase family protein [Balneolaceae bacterium]
MNPFYNIEEKRFRAGIRLLLYVILTIICVIPISLIAQPALKYIATAIAFFIAAYLATRGLDNRKLSGIGLSWNRTWFKEFIIGALIAFIAQTLIFLIEWQSGWLEIKGFGWNRVGEEFWILSIGFVFIQMLSVGFFEEILFRGYPIRNLAEGFTFGKLSPQVGLLIAVILTSSLFGIAHATNPEANLVSTLNIILAGFMLALPFVLTGSLALSVGIHFSWNFVMGGIYGLPVSGVGVRRSLIQVHEVGPDIFTGGKFGPEAGLTGIFGMLLITFLIYAYHKKKYGKVGVHSSFLKNYLDGRESFSGKDELV